MRSIYLPIRSFGDFIITAAIVKDNFIEAVPVILPDYLTEIFKAIEGDKYFEITGTISYNNQPAFFEMYKVRDIKNIKRLVNDMLILQKTINKKDEYILDYSSKRLFFTGAKFIWPQPDENIYDSKLNLLINKGLLSVADIAAPMVKAIEPGSPTKILLLPDSRISEKSINDELIRQLVKQLNEFNINTGYFSFGKITAPGQLLYSNFMELIELVSAYDLVISAESLPYHLANFLNKPHFVIYNQSKHFKSSFMTPFMIRNNYYSTFTGDNHDAVIGHIRKLLVEKKDVEIK